MSRNLHFELFRIQLGTALKKLVQKFKVKNAISGSDSKVGLAWKSTM